MNKLSSPDFVLKWLKRILICIVAANLICGAVSLYLGENLFFVSLSIWVLGGLTLAILQGVPNLGWKNVLALIVIAMVCSEFFESMGVNFGLFFSKYTYTGYIPGPKLFGFDVYSMVGYGVGSYMMWAIAKAAVGMYGNHFEKGDVFFVPLVAALLLVSIDFATDPLMATVSGAYVWQEHGVYYGIPYQNYLGWYLMAYTMYQIFALLLYWQDKKGKLPLAQEITQSKKYWIYPPLYFATAYITLPFNVFIQTSAEVFNGAGQAYLVSDIHWGVLLVYTGAILTPAVIIFLRTLHAKDLR